MTAPGENRERAAAGVASAAAGAASRAATAATAGAAGGVTVGRAATAAAAATTTAARTAGGAAAARVWRVPAACVRGATRHAGGPRRTGSAIVALGPVGALAGGTGSARAEQGTQAVVAIEAARGREARVAALSSRVPYWARSTGSAKRQVALIATEHGAVLNARLAVIALTAAGGTAGGSCARRPRGSERCLGPHGLDRERR